MKRLVLGLISGLCICAITSVSFGQVETDEPAQPAAPPIVLKPDAVVFQPSSPGTGDKLSLKIKKSDDLASAEVKWSINGEYIETSHYDGFVESIPLNAKIKAGDVIEAVVTPRSLSGVEGQPVLKKVTCRRPAPVLKVADQKIEGNLYTAKVVATDLEGGPLTLSLSGPPGMVMDSKGTITWKMSENTSGDFNVKVTAKDQAGGQSELTYSFRITRRR